MTFWQKALNFVSGKTNHAKKAQADKNTEKKPVSEKYKRKSVKIPKKVKKQHGLSKKTAKKAERFAVKKHFTPAKRIRISKKMKFLRKKKHLLKKTSKKIPSKLKVELIEEKLPKKRALALLKEPEVVEFITGIVGDEGYKMYTFLVNVGTDIDEYTLADKVQLQINYARSLLYKLYDYKLVSFFRERDKKKGWFIYYWKAHPEKLKYILIRKKEEKIENLQKELLLQHDSFFCENCKKNFEYTKAIENMFFCDTCGNQLTAINVSEVKARIKSEIEKLKHEIEEIKKI